MSSDPFRYDDGAYVLGALDTAERAAFEAHLETCAECRERVTAARESADLLAGVLVSDLDDVPMPDTLLPGLLRAARQERRRQRWLTGSLAAVAAACAIALAVVLWPSGGGSPTTAALPFRPVGASPVHATAQLVAKGWGTQIDLRCHYVEGWQQTVAYQLVVIDAAGQRHVAGSWQLTPQHTVEWTGGTALPEKDIARLQITLKNGHPILQLNV